MKKFEIEVDNLDRYDNQFTNIALIAYYKGEYYNLYIDDFDIDYDSEYEPKDRECGINESITIDEKYIEDGVEVDNITLVDDDCKDITEENKDIMDEMIEEGLEDAIHDALVEYIIEHELQDMEEEILEDYHREPDYEF